MKVSQKKNVHEGHRERMRKRALVADMQNFSDHELLEMALFNVIKRGNTNPLAHELLDTFGSLESIITADYDELKAIDGVGDSTAGFIKVLGELYRRTLERDVKLQNFRNTHDTIEFMKSLFKFAKTEKAYMLCTDKSYNLIAKVLLSQGDSGSVVIDCTEVCKKAILLKAKYVILVHNHLFGSIQPSESDFLATKEIMGRLFSNGIIVLDHLIIKNNSYLSFRENKILDEWFSRISNKSEEFTSIAKDLIGFETNGERISAYLLLKYL